MKRHLLIAMALGACAWAAADVRVFVTSSAAGYGLDLLGPQGDGTGTDPYHEDWPIDPSRPTYSTVTDSGDDVYAYDYYYAYYRAAAYPPIDAPSGTLDNPILIDVSAGQWGYIWLQFRGEPKGASIRANLAGTEAGTWMPTSALTFAYYLQNDRDNPGFGLKRWEGFAFPPEYLDWRNNPQTLESGVGGAYGLRNESDNPANMFHHQSGTNPRTGVGLLAAVTGQPRDVVYEYYMNYWDYSDGTVPMQGEHAFFKFVPEPGGLTLLGIALALCRRRP
jgi:hypothetical protein